MAIRSKWFICTGIKNTNRCINIFFETKAKLPVVPAYKHAWLMHIWAFRMCIFLCQLSHTSLVHHWSIVSESSLAAEGRRGCARLRSRLAPPQRSSLSAFSHCLLLLCAECGLGEWALCQAESKRQGLVVMAIARLCCAASFLFLPSMASYCAAHCRPRGNTRIAVPLINWLSTAHQFTLCSPNYVFFKNGTRK